MRQLVDVFPGGLLWLEPLSAGQMGLAEKLASVWRKHISRPDAFCYDTRAAHHSTVDQVTLRAQANLIRATRAVTTSLDLETAKELSVHQPPYLLPFSSFGEPRQLARKFL